MSRAAIVSGFKLWARQEKGFSLKYTPSIPPNLFLLLSRVKYPCTITSTYCFMSLCAHVLDGYVLAVYIAKLVYYPLAPKVVQLEGNVCEVSWESIPPMRGDPIIYILQVLVARESEYKQVRFHSSNLNCLWIRTID